MYAMTWPPDFACKFRAGMLACRYCRNPSAPPRFPAIEFAHASSFPAALPESEWRWNWWDSHSWLPLLRHSRIRLRKGGQPRVAVLLLLWKTKHRNGWIAADDFGHGFMADHAAVARGDRDILNVVRGIGNYAALHAVFEIHMHEELAGIRVQSVEKSAHFAGENKIRGRESDSGYKRRGRFVAPALFAGGRVKSAQSPAGFGKRPMCYRAAEVAFLSGVGFFNARRVFVLLIHRAPQIIARHHDQTKLGTVAAAVPFVAAEDAGAHFDGRVAERRLGIELRGERHGVDNLVSFSIDHAQHAVFAGRGDHGAGIDFENRIDVRDVVIIDVVRNELVVPKQFACFSIQSDHRIRVQVRAGPDIVPEIGRRIAARHVKNSLFAVVRLRRPERAARVLARFGIGAPGISSRLAVLRNNIEFPELLSVAQAERAHPSAAGPLRSRGTDVDRVVRDERGHADEVARLGIGNLFGPEQFPGLGVERDQIIIPGAANDFPIRERRTAMRMRGVGVTRNPLI